jgi:uncharacterized membrane protein
MSDARSHAARLLVATPAALSVATLLSYLIYAQSGAPIWFHAGFAANVAAAGAGLLGLLPWFFKWLLSPDNSETVRPSAWRNALRLTAFALFVINVWIYDGAWRFPPPNVAPGIVLGGLGLVYALGATWRGSVPRLRRVALEPAHVAEPILLFGEQLSPATPHSAERRAA